MGLAVQREQQRNRMFSYSIRRIYGDSRDGQVQVPGDVDIHIVESRRAKGHQLNAQARQHFQTRPVQLVVDEYANSSRILCRGSSVFRQTELQKAPLNTMVG